MKTHENERRDSGLIIILILLLGFICIILASGWALRFAPSWKLDTNMGSNLDPNNGFLTSRPASFIEPLDPAILTNPVWIDGFLTPGMSFPMRTAQPTGTSTLTPVPLNTNTPIPTFTVVPTNTLVIVVIPPATTTPKPPPPPPPPSHTNTPVTLPPSADLQITKTDNATDYDANISVQYIIVASNAGPDDVIGATVTDTFSANLTNITWTCTTTSPGASCTAAGSGNISDTVNLPVGTSVTYTVNATVIASPSGPLVNTATVSSSVSDPASGNNSKTDTDQLVAANPFPPSLTTNGDGLILNMSTSSFLDSQLASPLTLDPTSQIIYYPDPTAPTLSMDAVILQLGDGKNWYTILNWGDGLPNANTDTPAIPACAVSETDNCVIDPSLLANSPGITINLNGLIPAGTYPYIRIKSPSNPPDSGDGVSIDAIVVVP
jgi:uncharacterized repeat protein (TIGR01451 family)